MQQVQLYDDQLDFEQNKQRGPFGDYANILKPYTNTGEPKYDFFGISVYSPFGIAAGPLPTPAFIDAALKKGFDIVTLKSVRTASFPINRYPHVRPLASTDSFNPDSNQALPIAKAYNEPLAVANSFGIPSVSPKEWQPAIRQSLSLPGKGQALMAAFQGTAHGKGRDDFVNDYVKGIGLIHQTGASIIEANLSCPNEGEATLACFDTDITTQIVRAIRKTHPSITLVIKITYFNKPAQLRNLIQKIGSMVDGISANNTIAATVIDAHGHEAFPGRPTAGISGAPIKWAGLEMTRLLHTFRQEFGYSYKIIGIGGVLCAQDFHEYLGAGADYVMSVTGAMWNPDLAAEIKASL